MTDKIKPLQQASEAQPEPADFDTWLKEQFEYKNWYYREGGSGGMAVPFARKAWNAGFAKGVLAQQHVGDSRFEGWYGNEFDAKHKGTKQQMREAYEADMKNTIAAPRPAPTQQPAKPVSWHREPSDLTSCLQKLIDALYDNSDPVSVDAAEFLEKLYTTPPPAQQPLTKAQIKALIVATPEPDDSDVGKWVLSLIRAVEKAHKIGSRP